MIRSMDGVKMMGKAVAFTGHRPEALPFGADMDSDSYYDFELVLWKVIDQSIAAGYDTFYCGGARGVDLVCGEIIAANKLSGLRYLKLICAIPFKQQADKWSYLWRLRYQEVLKAADRIKLISPEYHRGCYHARNRYMVDNADRVIAVYDGSSSGGTAYTVDYARKQGKEIIIINPFTLEQTHVPAAT